MKQVQVNRREQHNREDSVEELKKKLELKRAERSLYYPENYRCYRSRSGVSDFNQFSSSSSCPRHYEREHDIDACRNSQVNMGDTNLRNYFSDCQERKENLESRHRGEKRHLQGHTIHASNIGSFGDDFTNKPIKHTGERRHFEATVDNVDRGSNLQQDRADDDNVSVLSSGSHYKDDQNKTLAFFGQAHVSQRRHYGQSSGDSCRSLANTNLRQSSGKHPDTEDEIIVEPVADEEEIEELRVSHGTEDKEKDFADQIDEQNEVWEQANDAADEFSGPGSMGEYDNKKNSSADNLNLSSKSDDSANRRACYASHNELIHQIQDLATRELQACKKQNWSEALRLRDMRNRLELQREIAIFNQDDLNMNNEARRTELTKIDERMKLMDERGGSGNQHLVYSEEARTLWETRVREDDKILSKEDRTRREILLKELEEEWEAMTLKDKEIVAESPTRHQTSHLQEELELTAAAMEKVIDAPNYYASNQDSKNSCTRNKDKGASSLIFLG